MTPLRMFLQTTSLSTDTTASNEDEQKDVSR
jgi:hypothetical protein